MHDYPFMRYPTVKSGFCFSGSNCATGSLCTSTYQCAPGNCCAYIINDYLGSLLNNYYYDLRSENLLTRVYTVNSLAAYNDLMGMYNTNKYCLSSVDGFSNSSFYDTTTRMGNINFLNAIDLPSAYKPTYYDCIGRFAY